VVKEFWWKATLQRVDFLFLWGWQRNVRLTSRKHCNPLQQWCCDAVMDFLQLTIQQWLALFFGGLDYPKNCPFPLRDLDSHLIHGSLGSPKSAVQSASRSVQLFLQCSQTWPMDRHTHTHTDRQTTLLRRATAVMQPKTQSCSTSAVSLEKDSRHFNL